MGVLSRHAARAAATFSIATLFASLVTPALAETSGINAADTAWMIAATALVLMMTIPGLALFSGMVRKKNVLATMAQALPPWRSFLSFGSRSAIRWRSSATVPGSERSIAGSSPA
jgi:hypothetical protein